MNQFIARCIALLMLTCDLYSIDLFLHHFNRKTKKINMSTGWHLKESGVFNPRLTTQDAEGNPISNELIDYSEVSPMLKITSPDVEFFGEKHSITSSDIYHGGLVGIEVGYSPAELQADSTLQQPTAVRIKDLRLYNFDCGLIIHHGVKNITIENCVFSGCSIGILALGQEGDVLNNSILDLQLKDVTVVGHAGQQHLALEKLKSRVEVDFGYPVDHFMKLQKDTLNNDIEDVYTYAGVWIICGENITLKNIKVHHIGYCDYSNESEGDGFRTHGIGICLNTCRRVSMQNVTCNDCFSELKAVGMQIDNVLRLRLKNAVFSHHTSACTAMGIEVVNSHNLDYSVDEVAFDYVSCESMVGNRAIGMSLTNIRGLFGNNLIVKFNKGVNESYGLYSEKGHTIVVSDSTFSSMISTKVTNDVETEHGVIAAGIYGKNIQGFEISSCNCVTMEALNSAIGLYLKDSSDIRVQSSQFSANTALTSRLNEATDICSEQDISEISRYGPVVPATSTGGYGIFADNCQRMKVTKSLTVSNKGHRAAGISCRTCKSIFIIDTTASAQIATGLMLDTSFLIDHVADPTSSTIQAAHKPLLFSELTKSSVDLVTTTDLFLEKMTAIRSRQAVGLDPLYDDVVGMLASQNLLQATVARYRLWGTAFGIHAHNSVGCIFKNNLCLGQVSLFDNAVGICFSGRNSGHLVEDCNLSYNVGWYLSSQAIPTSSAPTYYYKYDLSGMKVFWEALTNPWSAHRSLSNTYTVQALAFSPDGTLLASGDSNNEVKVWDTATWTLLQTLTGHTASVTSLAWSADGTKLASGASSTSDNIKVWNTTTWVADQTLTHGAVGVDAVAFKSDGTQLASGSADTSGNIKIWDTLTWLAVQTLTHGSVGTKSLAWKGNDAQLASGSADSANNIKIWNAVTWLEDQTLSSHTASVNSVAWSPDDSLLASGSSDNTVKIWNTSTWLLDQTLTDHTNEVNQVIFKENGKKLIAASSDNSMNVWDTTTWGSAEKNIVVHAGAVNALAWKGDGIKVASGSTDTTIKICYADTWRVAADDNAVGIYNPTPYFIVQGQKLFGDGTQGDDISIRLKGANDRVMVSPIGPIGAGLVLGDFMIDAYIKNNKMQFNVGNAGFAYGALFNVSYYSVLEQNLVEGSLASIYGFGSGLLEVTPHSVNTYIRNILESNKVSTFSNANYMVPYNPADTNTLAFPVTKMFNGNFAQPTTDLDNIVIEYSQSSQAYTVESLVNMPLHPDLKNQLTDNNCWK